MALDAAEPHILPRKDIRLDWPARPGTGAKNPADTPKIFVTNILSAVRDAWQALEAQGIESPAQSFDYVRTWIDTFDIPPAEQVFIVVELAGAPLALLPLQRTRRFGLRVLQPFGGRHVGCHGPLVDKQRFARLTPLAQAALWREMARAAKNCDLIYLPHTPHEIGVDFGALGQSVPVDRLYRAQFSSWQECERTQRSRSRRKHDRQQGARLAALGQVRYEELGAKDAPDKALDILFRDRAARFAKQGIADPFAPPRMRAFYRSVFAQGEHLHGCLQVLRLDGEIVAVRYNLVRDARMFCLISSMSMRPEVQPGSPGKQIMVHLMQSIFAQGVRSFDMGAGFSDEKRHWCNIQIPLHHHYVALSPAGAVAGFVHRCAMRIKGRIKANRALFGRLKKLRSGITLNQF